MNYGIPMSGVRPFSAIKKPVNITFGQDKALSKADLTPAQTFVMDIIKDNTTVSSEKTLQERRKPKDFLEKCLNATDVPQQTFGQYLNTLPKDEAVKFLDTIAEQPLFKNAIADKAKGKPVALKSLDGMRAVLTGKPREYQSESLAVSLAKQFMSDKFQPDRESILTDYVKKDRQDAVKEAFKFLDYGLQNYEEKGTETGVRRNLLTIFDEISTTDKGKAYLEGLRETFDDKMFQDKMVYEAREAVAHPKQEKPKLVDSLKQIFQSGQSTDSLAQELANRGIKFTMPSDEYFLVPEKSSAEIPFNPIDLEQTDLRQAYLDAKNFPMKNIETRYFEEGIVPPSFDAFISDLSLKEGRTLLAKVSEENAKVDKNPLILEMKEDLMERLNRPTNLTQANGSILKHNWSKKLVGMIGEPFGPNQDSTLIEKHLVKAINKRIHSGDNPSRMYPTYDQQYTSLQQIHDFTSQYYKGTTPESTAANLIYKDNQLTLLLLTGIIKDCQDQAISKAVNDFNKENHAPPVT